MPSMYTADERARMRREAREDARYDRRTRHGMIRRGTAPDQLARRYGVDSADIELLKRTDFFITDEDGEISPFMLPDEDEVQEAIEDVKSGRVSNFNDVGDEDDEDEDWEDEEWEASQNEPLPSLTLGLSGLFGALQTALGGRQEAGTTSTWGDQGAYDGQVAEHIGPVEVEAYDRIVDGKIQHVGGYTREK